MPLILGVTAMSEAEEENGMMEVTQPQTMAVQRRNDSGAAHAVVWYGAECSQDTYKQNTFHFGFTHPGPQFIYAIPCPL